MGQATTSFVNRTVDGLIKNHSIDPFFFLTCTNTYSTSTQDALESAAGGDPPAAGVPGKCPKGRLPRKLPLPKARAEEPTGAGSRGHPPGAPGARCTGPGRGAARGPSVSTPLPSRPRRAARTPSGGFAVARTDFVRFAVVFSAVGICLANSLLPRRVGGRGPHLRAGNKSLLETEPPGAPRDPRREKPRGTHGRRLRSGPRGACPGAAVPPAPYTRGAAGGAIGANLWPG